jgi:hypothetical protein
MTQSLSIETGLIRLAINGDETRVISFNPSDALFAEKFYKMLGTLQERFANYRKQAEAVEAKKEADSNGIPLNTGERIELMKEVCIFAREQIDELFGNGASQTVFEDALSIEAIIQFFEGVRPYMQKARAEKVARYTNKTYQKRK